MSDQKQPIFQVTNFTDLNREILQFDEVGTDLTLNTPKRFFRGRAQVQFSPRMPPTLFIFELDEKTIDECFKVYDLQLGKAVAHMRMKMVAEGKLGPIIPATSLPPLPK
jgi:hypothetical protein